MTDRSSPLELEQADKTFLDSKDRKSTPSELQSLRHLVCRLLLEKKNKNILSPARSIQWSVSARMSLIHLTRTTRYFSSSRDYVDHLHIPRSHFHLIAQSSIRSI